MKKMRILWQVIKQTRSDEIILSYLMFVFIDALVIFLVDPAIKSYGNALWYCCVVIFTVGLRFKWLRFFIKNCNYRTLDIFCSGTGNCNGCVVNFYSQLIRIRQEDTMEAFVYKLENLPDLSKEELKELSLSVKRLRKNK